jgi:membrane-associated protein
VVALSLIERIVEWIGPAFEVAGYWLVATAGLLERSVFVGLVIPGDVIIALGGVYAARGDLSLVPVIIVGSMSAIIGESIGYWLGRRYGMGLIRRLPLINRLEKRLERAEGYFQRHGGKTVAIGRFATAAGAFVPFLAGVGRMRYGRFLLFDIPAVIVWATAIALLGYVFGQNLDVIDTILSRFGYAVLGLVLAFFVVRFIRRKRRERVSTPSSDRGMD